MKLQRHLLLFGSSLCAIINVNAQSIGPSGLTAAGNSVNAGGITYEYAIGQTMSGATLYASNLILTPDVLQPASTTGISTPGSAISELQVFPSPMESTLYLRPSFKAGGTLHYSLYDVAGKQITNQEAALISGSEQQTISVERLPVGQYVLQVSWIQQDNTYTRSYKLQKLR
jgi:hypothetical protein